MQKYAAGYIRVSSDEQAQHGISVDAQRQILQAWAVTRQLDDIVLYEDPGFSGKNTQRPALQRLIRDAHAGQIDHVVVWKLDRLSRSLRDTLALIEDDFGANGATLISVTESIDTATPSGRMMLNLLASFAQLEREQDSDRVVMAHKHLAHDCRYLGGHIPMGYRVGPDRRYELDPPAAAAVRRVFDLYLSGSGYAQILDYLNGEAFPYSKKKKPWHKSDLNYLLNNPIYAGIYVRKIGVDKRAHVSAPEIITVPGGVPAILSADEWARVSAIREGNRAAAAKHGARTVYPLSGLVHCAVCGKLMPLNHGGKDRAGHVERYYTCRSSCVRPLRLEAAEAAVQASLRAMGADAAALVRACEIANGYAAAYEAERSEEAVALEKDVQARRRQIASITAFIREHGANAPASLMQDLHRLEAEIADLETRAEALRRPVSRYNAPATVSAVEAALAAENGPPDQRRALIQQAVHRVTVSGDSVTTLLAWHTYGGDDPPQYVCHTSPRHVKHYVHSCQGQNKSGA